MRIFIHSEDRYRIKEEKKKYERERKLVLIERMAWGLGLGWHAKLPASGKSKKNTNVFMVLGNHKLLREVNPTSITKRWIEFYQTPEKVLLEQEKGKVSPTEPVAEDFVGALRFYLDSNGSIVIST